MAFIAALFIAFAITHSVCVTDTVKKLMRSLLGETFVKAAYRFLFTCFSVLSVAIVFGLIRTLPDRTLLVMPVWLKVAFHLLQAAGAFVGIMPFLRFSILEFAGVSQLFSYLKNRTMPGDIEGISGSGLMTDGIYGVVRHPLYLAGILIFTFNPYITVNSLMVTVLADLYFVIGALIEEKRLRSRFGEEYEEYMKKVPRFIPSIRWKK
jgi:protein-S-isoprenylcysteine O-methyltransferase Ste14